MRESRNRHGPVGVGIIDVVSVKTSERNAWIRRIVSTWVLVHIHTAQLDSARTILLCLSIVCSDQESKKNHNDLLS